MKYTAKEVSEILDIGESTTRLWARQFGVPKRRGDKKIYTQEALDVLKTIKALKGDNAGMQTIKRKIGQDDKGDISADMPEVTPVNQVIKTVSADEVKTIVTEQLQTANQAISQQIRQEITQNNSLAEKYARATYDIGTLKQQVLQLQEQTKLLPAPMEWAHAQRDIQDLERQLNEARAELEAKQAQLDNETAKQTEWAEMGLWARIIAAIRGQAP